MWIQSETAPRDRLVRYPLFLLSLPFLRPFTEESSVAKRPVHLDGSEGNSNPIQPRLLWREGWLEGRRVSLGRETISCELCGLLYSFFWKGCENEPSELSEEELEERERFAMILSI